MGGSSSQQLYETPPPKKDGNRRLLPIDPRSPSTDIARTPILVDKTPEGAVDPMLDPRSPTAGIFRTPLADLAAVKQAVQPHDEIPAVPKLDLDTPVFPEVSPELRVSEDTAERDEVDHFMEIGLQNISLDEFPTSESTRLVDILPDKPIAETEKKPKKSVKAPQPKELFPNKKGLAVMDKNTRSPLSTRNVDMNSPLQIIQRKQTSKVDKVRISSTESPNARFIVKDKENL